MSLKYAWPYSGVEFNVEQSVANDEVSTAVQIPASIQAGGSGGIPLGWTLYTFGSGIDTASINFTTQDGRFSMSLKDGYTPNANASYGAYIDIPVKQYYRYIVSVDARTMQDKTPAVRTLKATTYGSVASDRSSQADWERASVTTQYVNATTPTMRITLSAYWKAASPANNWGVQFQNVKVLEQFQTLTPVTWKELTCDVQAVAFRYGRERFTGRYDVATAQITLMNPDGDYTYSEVGSDRMQPGRHVRVTARHPLDAGTPAGVFYGIVDSLIDGYTLDGKATTTLHLVDVSTLLASSFVATSSASESVIHTSGVRTRMLIDQTGWQRYALDAGKFSQQPVLANGRTIRDECGLNADSEGAHFFADRIGQIVFRDRTFTDLSLSVEAANKTVTANILAMGDREQGMPVVDGVPDAAGIINICAASLNVDWSRDRIINRLTLANQGGNAITYEDFDSQRQYGPADYQRVDFVNYNSSTTYLDTRANDLMTGWTEPKQRVNSVTFHPSDDATIRWALNAWFGNLVRVWYQHASEWGYAVVTRVQAIAFTVTPTNWEVSLTLDQPVSWSEWLELAESGWDIAAWDVDLWDGKAGDPGYWNSGQAWNDPVTVWGD